MQKRDNAMDQSALVSIIVPVYNAERFIEMTMDCVRAQTYENWEMLLVEDSSTDRSVEVIEKYIEDKKEPRIRLILQREDSGAAAARNRGLREAVGRYITYLDADDLWVPEKLEKQIVFMTEKNCMFSFTGYEFADENAKRTGKIVRVPEVLTYKKALGNTTIFTSTVMFDSSKTDKELLVMPRIESEDTALWWKILRSGFDAYGLDENLVVYRRPGKTLSSNKLKAVRRIWNLYRKAEGMSIPASCYYFVGWGFRAVARRI